ncbi:PEP-CTERM sorting domain-containing protein [Parvularcula sp. LCG005]|uniref:PEP-CTERM sorting domain-containing protein n=1 Tax=Parvularcula sp. LCG005 TaxID=3078805 RepID=UPI002943CCD4|nr:PEP-CTERM sorting domain-containing protein [Parvularcula sp. LCG005]WOI52781.1 hypothetical protein RUI03_11550 [Parvularcula sp. LCG005]
MFLKTITGLTVGACALIGGAFAAPVAVDLSTWVQDGNGNWILAGDSASVLQTRNSAPTVYHNNQSSQGKALAGTIKVETSSDDDFIGFVLGYTQGDIDGLSDTDYILVDWKQGTQGGWDRGMSISRVTGRIQSSGTDTNADQWDHVGNVEFLARANTLGSTGWADNTEYNFAIEFTASVIRVTVDGNLEFELFGSFSDGAFGFYNFSQPDVRYAGITEEVLPPVPLPAALPLMAAGLGVVGFARRKAKAAR